MKKSMKKITIVGVSGLLAAGLLVGSIEYASHTFREEHMAANAAVSANTDKEEEDKDASTKATKETEIGKEETIYILADASGVVEDVTVSNWLKTAGLTGSIEDVSGLTDIKNVKGEETFTQDGENVTWDAKGEDIYYQGSTDKQLPVDVTITYTLDGVEMKPQEMAGKSGKMEMTVSYENKEQTTATINGKKQKLTVPFLMITGMLLPTDCFSNVEVENGKVVSEGNNQIVVGIGMPGLAKSLDLDEEASEKIPASFTVTADVTDFSMGNTFTYGTSSLLGEIDFDDLEDLDKLQKSMDKLSDSSAKLIAGSEELEDGTRELADKYATFDEGIKTLAAGIAELEKGGNTLKNGAFSYIDGVDSLGSGVKKYVKGTNDLAKGVKSYVEGSKSLEEGINSVEKAAKDFPAQYAAFAEGLNSYTTGVEKMTDGETMSTLSGGAKAVSDGITAVNEGASQLSSGVSTLHAGAEKLEASFANNDKMIATLDAMIAAATGSGDVQAAATYTSLRDSLKTLTEQQKAGVKALADNTADSSALQQGIASIASQTGKTGALKAGADKLAGGLETMKEGASQLNASTKSLTTASGQIGAGISSLTEAVGSLAEGAETLNANNKALEKGAAKLQKSGKKLEKGAKILTDKDSSVTLREGIKELLTGIRKLNAGGTELKTGSTKLAEGITTLHEGSGTLTEGIRKFDKKGIKKLDTVVEDDLLNLKERFEALSEAASTYNSFSGIAEDMEGTVKFIYETEAITK